MHTATVSIVRNGRVEFKTISYTPKEAIARLKYLYGYDARVNSFRRSMVESTVRYAGA